MKNWWVFFILGGIVLAMGGGVVRALSANTDVVINEVGGYATSTHEWIEVWNKGSDTVDLTGWKFWEANTKHGVTAKVGDALLAPGEYGAIVQDDAQFMRDFPGFAGSVWDSSWGSLSESGEEIGLIDASGVSVEKFTYVPFNNYSLERVNPFLNDYTANNWREHASGNTVGRINSVYAVDPAAATTTPSDPVTPTTTDEGDTSSTVPNTDGGDGLDTGRWAFVHINELFPHTATGEQEWIELYNASTTAVTITGGSLCDGRVGSCTIARLEGEIPANGFLVITLSSSYLNNDGDTVILKNEAGGEVERVVYSGDSVPNSNESLARFADTEVLYNVTTLATPGAENILQVPATAEPKIVAPNSGGGNSASENAYPKTGTANKTTTTTAKTKSVELPKTSIAWSVSAPPFALVNEPIHFSAETSADPRGGELFMSWVFDDETTLDGGWVEHTFTTTGTTRVFIFATSTAGTVGTYTLPIPVLAKAEETGVVLNEVYSSANAGESEFVELANVGTIDKDISGWEVVVGSDKFFLPPSSTILAGGYRVLYRTATKLVLPNSGGLVTLLTNKNEVADAVVVPKTAPGKTYVRSEQGWGVALEPTPGFENSTIEVPEEKTLPQLKTKVLSSKNFVSVRALADLKELNGNQNVFVGGVVTVLPGVFGSQSFYITDDSGSAEIYSSKKNFPALKLGDTVRVSGAIGSGASVERVKIKNAWDVRPVGVTSSTANSITIRLVTEEMVGAVVQVTGEITQVKKGLFYVDDGTDEIAVVIRPGTLITVLPKVGETAAITGMIMRGKSGLELWPRGGEDVVLATSDATNTHPVSVPGTPLTYPAIGVVGGSLVAATWKWREALGALASRIIKRS